MKSWGIWLIESHGRLINRWLAEYDPDAGSGPYSGVITSTTEVAAAKRYESADACLNEWMRVSTRVPLRPDGKPNRPLSAFTIEPRRLPDAKEAKA
jgi:hypothetical protein